MSRFFACRMWVAIALQVLAFPLQHNLSAQTACSGQCPPCANNYSSNIYTANTQNGRQVYLVYVDTTWGTSQAQVASADQTAMKAWNDTPDPNSCNGRPYINFYFNPTPTSAGVAAQSNAAFWTRQITSLTINPRWLRRVWPIQCVPIWSRGR